MKTTFENISIKGIVSCFPQTRVENSSLYATFGETEIDKMSKMTGIQSRPVVDDETCTSDLCYCAAKKLLASLEISPTSIDALIFVSQTPDYILPPTSHVLHERLGLATDAAVFDVNLGCSGYTYGLWLASSLLQGQIDRVLLLVGDTCSKFTSDQDRSTFPLFGDAAAATIVENDSNSGSAHFVLGSDGGGANNLIIKAGGFRDPRRGAALQRIEGADGNLRKDDELFMNGQEVFTFTLNTVSPLIDALLEYTNSQIENVDYFVFHQANEFMLKHLAKKAGIPEEKMPLTMANFGNTSSASIPLTICQKLKEKFSNQTPKLAMFGFGVGLSWGAAMIESPIAVIDSIEFPDTRDVQANREAAT